MLPDQGVNSEVLIHNTCSWAKVAPCYHSLIEAAVRTYHEVLADHLVSVRLMGSVARGEAVVGQSDLDVMGLVDRALPSTALQALEQHAERLRRVYPVARKVDLDAVAVDDLSPFQRLVLSSDSLHLDGVDTLTQPWQTMDRSRLAALVTPDSSELIDGYSTAVQGLRAGQDDETLRLFSRVTGKDLLKCLRAVALLRGGAYEKGIEGIYAQVIALVPERRALADRLIELYRHPATDKDALLAALADAAVQIQPLCPPDDGVAMEERA